MPVSLDRASRLAALEGEQFDVIVIGGGIIGAGIARDAALRDLRVALFEKSDFGSGTTAGSTRLIHGGLRYLEMLDFRLVRMDLRERETLLRIAPHLVKPLEFIMPFYGSTFFYRSKMKMGMTLYDLLSYDRACRVIVSSMPENSKRLNRTCARQAYRERRFISTRKPTRQNDFAWKTSSMPANMARRHSTTAKSPEHHAPARRLTACAYATY